MIKEILVNINDSLIYKNFVYNLPYNPVLLNRAKKLRKAGVMSEVVFWRHVRNKSFFGIDFDRQRIIGNYIVDFYIKQLGLVIEIDGASHDDKQIYDKIREDYLISLGLKVYRITVDDVMKKMDFVIIGLEEYIITEYGKQLA